MPSGVMDVALWSGCWMVLKRRYLGGLDTSGRAPKWATRQQTKPSGTKRLSRNWEWLCASEALDQVELVWQNAFRMSLGRCEGKGEDGP